MHARTTPTRHELVDMFENTGCFTNHSSNDGCSCHQAHFRIDGRVVNHVSEGSMFRQVLMHPSERLMFRLPPRWISFPIQPNSNTSISGGKAVDKVDIHQLGIRITIHVHCTLLMSEKRKPHIPTFRAHVQRHLSLSAHAFQSVDMHFDENLIFPPEETSYEHVLVGSQCSSRKESDNLLFFYITSLKLSSVPE
ncbi:hypothetical protein TNCV_167621 [Trichonephila clavipes]|nr:hypothetical protein TNCV_167621 [Trichonephila clavipes]